ncbi:sialate O-acetylesterase [Tichowtungia aerotolerans]|uniref:Sialate O-acetylesterase n=1 Tax=Tichowtungia aerotolerans TaxID=2697043 RepID=A0A6P1M712_9BACT|nr:sialate O-acetylesterase [Tichowtungia aerotolerans]QHI69812.1 sialate O-acetylesterase [Tichowtungia aerotolerans]
MNIKKYILVLVAGVTASAVFAEVRVAPVFNDGAVLQCDMPVNVWGTADPGAPVTVSFAGQKKTAVASASGEWKVVLDPLKASSEPRSLHVSSSEIQVSLNDIVVGEVWLATGQSNMVMPLRNSTGGDERLKMTIPEIRFMKVPQQTGLPPDPMNAEQLAWKEFKPGPNNEIAAVAFYFAEYLQKQVGGPVGIVQCSYGGTPAEAWTPAWALDEKPELKYLASAIRGGLASDKTTEQWQKEKDAFWDFWRARREWAKTREGPAPEPVPKPGPDNPLNQQAPTVLFENMLKPLIPYTARGIVWYQGESNAGKPDEYRVLFPAMIDAWRKLWDRPDWPFFFVQISAYNHPTQDWPGLRDAQRFTRDTVPHTGMALSIDCGEKEEIHPWAKQPVGERLGLLAMEQVYGRDVVSRGPAFQTLEKEEDAVRVVFQYSEKGLETSDGKADVPGFEIAGADGEYHPAAAKIISSNAVELTCPEVRKPVSVRYAWHNWVEPPVTLQNSSGLPAEPFSAQK